MAGLVRGLTASEQSALLRHCSYDLNQSLDVYYEQGVQYIRALAQKRQEQSVCKGCTGISWEALVNGRYCIYPVEQQIRLEFARLTGQGTMDLGHDLQACLNAEEKVTVLNLRTGQRSAVRRRQCDICERHALFVQCQEVAMMTQLDAVVQVVHASLDVALNLQLWQRRMLDLRENWSPKHVKSSELLRGKKVAIVGSFVLPKGEVHAVVVNAGGTIHTAGSAADARVNRSTNVIVVGMGLGEDASTFRALMRLEELNAELGRQGRPKIELLTEQQLVSQLLLPPPTGEEGCGLGQGCESYPHVVQRAIECSGELQQRHLLTRLMVETGCWRDMVSSQPLKGLEVAATGVMLCLNWTGEWNTHSALSRLVKQCGGCVKSSVSRGSTDVLVVGCGEKGENGKPNGKGEPAESSQKYLNAVRFNKTRKRRIAILAERELLVFLFSGAARKLQAAVAADPPVLRQVGCQERTSAPRHKPNLRAVRFTSVSQQAHGRGEPGAKGALLADALAAPEGATAVGAVIVAQSLSEPFLWTMLQIASCADGAPPALALEEIVMVRWSGATGDEAHDMQLHPIEDGGAASEWLGGLHHLPTAGCSDPGLRPRVGTRCCPEGTHQWLDRIVRARRKPRIGVAHSLLAQSTVQGHGQCHSKFVVLHFKPTTSHGGGVESVRLVVSSGNFTPGSFGGMPGHRQLCGLWWADFEVHDSVQPRSPFRDALLEHVDAVLASRQTGGATRESALASWAAMREVWQRAGCSSAEDAGTTLLSHTPGSVPRCPGQAQTVPKGLVALEACFAKALRHPGERLDLSIIAHCCSGWSSGGDGEVRFKEWCAVAAPNGGKVRFHWPRKLDSSILGEGRTKLEQAGMEDCSLPTWVRQLPMVELRLRPDVIQRREDTGYMCTPHLMLYVLHEPIVSKDHAPVVRRQLLTSANLSAAPWGYEREGQVEIRSFEMGVCVHPESPVQLVEPFVDLMAVSTTPEAHARAIPFDLIHADAPGADVCLSLVDPYVGRALIAKSQAAQIGHLNY